MRQPVPLPDPRRQPQQRRQCRPRRAEPQQRAHECEQQYRAAALALDVARSGELKGSPPAPSNGCMILGRVPKKPQSAARGTNAEARRRRP